MRCNTRESVLQDRFSATKLFRVYEKNTAVETALFLGRRRSPWLAVVTEFLMTRPMMNDNNENDSVDARRIDKQGQLSDTCLCRPDGLHSRQRRTEVFEGRTEATQFWPGPFHYKSSRFSVVSRELWTLTTGSAIAEGPRDIPSVLQCCQLLYNRTKEGSAVADKPARRAASRRTRCKQTRLTLSVINLRVASELS